MTAATPAATLDGSRGSLLRRRPPVGLSVFGGYLLVAFVFFALPVLLRGGPRYAGGGPDQRLFIWSFAWWPHAILHGVNPFYTRVMWAPGGFNLAWTTTVPGLALLFAPVTLLAGPVAAFNIATVVMPAIGAYCAYALCRYVTGRLWPAVFGGYLFGFSTYVLYEEALGHVNLDTVFVLPLTALVVLKFLDRRLTGRGLILRLGPLLAFQLLSSTEIAFTLTVALLAGLVLAFAFAKERRARIGDLLLPLVGSYILAALLTAPFLYYLLMGFERTGFWGRPQAADLANFLIPPEFSLLGGSWGTALSRGFNRMNDGEEVFFGLPALLLVALWTLRAGNRFLIACFLVTVVAELGPHLDVYGHSILPAPWDVVKHAPVFDNVLPARLAVYLALLVGVTAALWLARVPSSPLTTALTVLAVVVILPDPVWSNWSAGYAVPAFLTRKAYRNCLDPGQTVLPLPATYGTPVLWQALNGFHFNIAAGPPAANPPASYQEPAAIGYITDGGHLGPADSVRADIHRRQAGDERRRRPGTSGFLPRRARPHRRADAVGWSVDLPPDADPAVVRAVVAPG